jgi:L-rhamnose mutarotase
MLLITFLASACALRSNTRGTEFEEYVFGVRLVEDSAMQQKYLDYHQQIWPEVEEGFRKAGYEQVRLFCYGHYITMVVKVPKGSDLNRMGQISNDSHPRVAEWNKLMDGFQRGLPGTADGQTWVMFDKLYEFKKEKIQPCER